MTTTQTQIRRDTATNIAAATPAEGELGYDKTNKRLLVGDGSTLGGIPHVSAADGQKQAFVYAAVGGTANAITLTNSAFPATAYAAPLKQVFKATASNSGAVTVNVDGLGTKNVKKMENGALAALVTGDIISGGIYEISYDGTQFQILSAALTIVNSSPGTFTNATVTVDAYGRVTSASSGTSGVPTALGVGATILATCSTAINADSTTSAANLTIRKITSGGTTLGVGTDTLSGTWKALETITSPNEGGIFQRTV